MSLECSICRDSYGKLKQLDCRHAFCRSCLTQIERRRQIRCPYCRQETTLSAFGVEELMSTFGGKLSCAECPDDKVAPRDARWCAACRLILCQACAAARHASQTSSPPQHQPQEHRVESVERNMAPVVFCIQQLDRLSAIHTRLTVMQKRLIAEYLTQLGQAFQRQLNDDLAARLRMLKSEKQYLRRAFDLGSADFSAMTAGVGALDFSSPPDSMSESPRQSVRDLLPTSSVHDHQNLSLSPENHDTASRFASVLREVYKMSPISNEHLRRRSLDFGISFENNSTDSDTVDNNGFLATQGIIFNPPTIDKMLDLCMESGKFSQFSISLKKFSVRPDITEEGLVVKKTPPSKYYGSGILDDPCDLCVMPERNVLLVTCVKSGIYSFLIDEEAEWKAKTGKTPVRHYPPKILNDQYAGISYDVENRYICATVLRDYSQWMVQIYERRGMRLRAEIPCPNEPRIQNRWYRWITCVSKGHAIVTTGDKRTSTIWLLNLNSHKWKLLLTRYGATFRKASYHQPRPSSATHHQGLLYVPDMHKCSVVTLLLDTHAWTLGQPSEIRTAEFARELPISVNVKSGKLVVGYWRTGNVVYADLAKCTSMTLTCVGAKELFNSCFLDLKTLFVICKQKEVVEMYCV